MKHIQPPKLSRRIVALLFDLIVLLLLTEVAYFLVTTKILTNHLGGAELNDKITAVQKASNLYGIKENGLFEEPNSEKKPEALYKYYVESNLAPKQYTADLYYDEILKRTDESVNLFNWEVTISSQTPWLIEVAFGQEEAAETFYKTAWQKAAREFIDSETYSQYADPLLKLESEGHIITMAIFIFVVFLLIPSFTPHGATLGELLTQIGHVTMYGYKMSKGQKAYRAMTGILVNWIGLIFAVPIVSLVIMSVRKDGRTLTDLGAGSLTVDIKNSMIFNNITEEEEFNALLADQKAAIDDWHEENLSHESNDKRTKI